MANGVWVDNQALLGSEGTAILQDCVARELFDIYVSCGYPSPAQGTRTFPELSGFVPDSSRGIVITEAQVTTILGKLASVDSRLKAWAWFGTWSTDETPPPPSSGITAGDIDKTGHYWARMSINTPARRAAVINAIMTVANWGFYGIQDDTEDLLPDSLEANGQFGTTYVTFTNELATAAHAAGKKCIPFVPAVWYNFSDNFLQNITVPDAIIMAGLSESDVGQWNLLTQLFFDRAARPVLWNFGWPEQAQYMLRLNSLPFSGVATQIVGYTWYRYQEWAGNWGTWDTWRSNHPSTANNRSYEIGGGGGGGGGGWVWDGKKIPDAMRDAATIAANAAANGSKNAAYRNYIKNAIGDGFRRKLIRENVVVWEATDTGYLPESGNAFVLDATVTQLSISNADIDSGVWIHRIEHLTDPTKFIATSVSTVGGGGSMTLSGDLVAGGQIVLGALTLNCPTFDTGSQGVPGGGVSLTLPSAGEIAGAEYIWNDFTEMTQGNSQMLLVDANSPLDLSWVLTTNTTSAFGGDRLLGLTMSGWNWPDAGMMPTYIEHVKRTGAKMLRFMGAGSTWEGNTMYSKINDPNDEFGCWYDPAGMDTMKRYFAKMSDAGMKLIVGIRWQGNDWRKGAGGNFWGNYPTAEENSSFLYQVGDARGIRHWEACFDIVFTGMVNHYNTPKQLIDDPNLICIDIINENNLQHIENLMGHDGSGTTALAWRYASWVTSNPGKAYMEYIHTMHTEMVNRARAYALSKGYATTRKLSSNNYIPDYVSAPLRIEELNVTDIHLYQDLADTGDGFHNQSIIANDNFGHAYLFPYFGWNQTSLTTEWSMGGPNIYGYEFPLYGAYWSMQGGNWIVQFNWMIQALYNTDANAWWHYAQRFYQGHDATKDIPAAVSFRAAAFMFQRKDVTESTTSIGIVLRKNVALNRGPGDLGRLPRNVVLLANFVKIRMVKASDVNGSLQWIGAGTGPTVIIDPMWDSTTANRSMADWITWLKNNNLITNDNTSDASIGRYESGTKEIRVTRDHRSARVQSARSHMVVWDNPAQVDNTSLLVIESATPKGMVSIHDIGTGTPGLATTDKILLMTASIVRGKNSGNNNPTNIVAHGSVEFPWQEYAQVQAHAIQDSSGSLGYNGTALPVKIRGSIVVVKVKAALGTWAIYRLNIRGGRVASVPYEWTNDNYLRFVLDNTSGAALMQTAYYEMIKIA